MIRIEIKVLFEQEDLMEDFCWQHGALAVDRLPISDQPQGSVRKVGALFSELDVEIFSEKAFQIFSPKDLISIHSEEVREEAWQESWRLNFQAFSVGRMRIVPEWDSLESSDDTLLIYPGQAFGTGQHETTKLMLKALQKRDLKGKSVLDIGCGSGILSIAAEKCGADRAYGFDIDPDCTENMERHLTMNHCSRTSLHIGSLDDVPHVQYDVILMNITINVLMDLWPRIGDFLKPGGVVISSGILREQAPLARASMRDLGYIIQEEDFMEEWFLFSASRASDDHSLS